MPVLRLKTLLQIKLKRQLGCCTVSQLQCSYTGIAISVTSLLSTGYRVYFFTGHSHMPNHPCQSWAWRVSSIIHW